MDMMKRITCLIAGLLTLTLCAVSSFAKDYRYERDIPYRPASDTLSTNKMCRLDIAYLEDNTNAPVIVWFHGGGLTGGHRELPQALRVEPFVLIGVEYRLSPEASTDETIDDAAAAVAWAFDNAAKYGGSPDKIYIAGHSAGGYLVNMVGLDKARLAKYGKDADKIAAIIPYSGHAITHYNTREKMGMPPHQAFIDSTAPIYYVRKDAPPMLIISGDREMELYGRYEETAYFWRMLKLAGHPDVILRELDGFDHGGMAAPGHLLTIKYIRDRERK